MTPRLHHRVDGPADAPVLVLGPSLGTSLGVWEPQMAGLAARFRVVRWDLPGHGRSPASLLPAGSSVAGLGQLVLDLADSLGADSFAYAGISLGGAVGVWLAARRPRRVSSLALVCSSAHFGGAGPWRERAALVRTGGTEPLAGTAPGRWFTPGFATSGDAAVEALVADLRAADPEAYAVCCEILAGLDLRDGLGLIDAPTLVVAGRDDPATPPAHARELADGIRDATLVELPRAAHLAGVERPGAVLDALLSHLGRPPADPQDRYAAGMAVRREVLGDAHVDRAIAATTPFTARFQDFITRYAWGEIWTGGTLDRRTRSCITLTALVAGGHRDELAMHVRAAVRNGLTPEEIGEVLLQSAVYCGVPAANSAFAAADRVLRDLAEERAEDEGH
ncbi:3-oxoadipate enol-lactonase [Streptomyces sp. GMY02]|uniref:bifunctional 3-oxoadipate enol-lactonase/4-carboxymuconolactone decarboxylase PcaDC n=1 Tax=Streptomyces sp. GMY02 TaxID=1333528 RepID=UPI001C2BA5A4|nr:3-oxoadipate enol-lactonase [Streptomyces sp. GMY02]QXE38307.1 3-oxoadipate enol-lactonase [Streptomyces sp. GMY02]